MRRGGGRRLTLTFPDAVRFLTARPAGGSKWSLEPTRALLDRLGHPERHFEVVHVGGTNGKGSVAALVYEALRAGGRRAALYTSPHLVDVRERMVVDGRPISAEAFTAWTARLHDDITAVGASFFEATTAIAFADAAARGAEVAVVEVGLGGRLDSTNVVDPLVSAVTHVVREHTEYLGDTIADIAREKAGIAKPGRPFVVGETDPGVLAVLVATAEARGAPVRTVPPASRYDGPLSLLGDHQRRNAAVAWAVLNALPEGWQPGTAAVHRGFRAAWLPGRYDRRGAWIFDVAHNAGATASLVAALRTDRPRRPLHALVAILRDKDWRTMLGALSIVADRTWVTTAPSAPGERRWDLADVGRTDDRWVVEPDFDAAVADVQRGAGTMLVTGSFHTVGDALARLPGFAPLG